MIPFEIACDLIVVLLVEVRRKAESTPLVPVVFAAATGAPARSRKSVAATKSVMI